MGQRKSVPRDESS